MRARILIGLQIDDSPLLATAADGNKCHQAMPVHAASEECRSWLLGHRWKLKHGAKVKKGSLFWRDPMKDEHNYYLCLNINCYKYQSSITRLERSEMKIIRSYLPKLNCAAGHGQTHGCGLPERSRVLISGCGWAHLRQVSYQSPRRLPHGLKLLK